MCGSKCSGRARREARLSAPPAADLGAAFKHASAHTSEVIIPPSSNLEKPLVPTPPSLKSIKSTASVTTAPPCYDVAVLNAAVAPGPIDPVTYYKALIAQPHSGAYDLAAKTVVHKAPIKESPVGGGGLADTATHPACLAGHLPKRKYGWVGILGGIAFFPWGLFWTRCDSHLACTRCSAVLCSKACPGMGMCSQPLEAHVLRTGHGCKARVVYDGRDDEDEADYGRDGFPRKHEKRGCGGTQGCGRRRGGGCGTRYEARNGCGQGYPTRGSCGSRRAGRC